MTPILSAAMTSGKPAPDVVGCLRVNHHGPPRAGSTGGADEGEHHIPGADALAAELDVLHGRRYVLG